MHPPTKGEPDDVSARALYAGVGVCQVHDAPPVDVVIEWLLAEARADV